MQFINSKGEIEEGFPLTEAQVQQRAQILALIHEKVCGGGNHYDFQRRSGDVKCEPLANYFITKFKLVPTEGVSLQGEIDEAVKENAPEVIEAPPAPVPVPELTVDEMF